MSFSSYGKRNNYSLPSHAGKEMKPKDEFSQSQLRRLADMVARGQRIDSTKGVITCIAHSGAPQDELKCRGPCGKYKHISEFSKNMRKSSGGRRWCIKCTEWSEATGNGLVPLPASNNLRTQEERYLAKENGRYLEHAEGEARAAVAMHPGDSSVGEGSSYVKSGDPEALSLFQALNLSADEASADRSGTSSPGGSRDSSPPPARAPHHLMPPMPFNACGAQAEPTYQTDSAPSLTSTTSRNVAVTVTRTNNGDRQEYRAWGPDGKMVTRFKESTVVSETLSTAVASEVSTNEAGWSKPQGRRQPLEPPSYLAYEDPDLNVDYSDGSNDTM